MPNHSKRPDRGLTTVLHKLDVKILGPLGLVFEVGFREPTSILLQLANLAFPTLEGGFNRFELPILEQEVSQL